MKVFLSDAVLTQNKKQENSKFKAGSQFIFTQKFKLCIW